MLDPERFLAYEGSIRTSRLVDRVLRLVDRPGLSLCDVGGASGVFLDEIARRARYPFEGTVLEVRDDYRAHLVRRDLRFLRASILDGSVPGSSFDVVTTRHMLHHLVGATLAETRRLQARALAELVRITRPGGHLVFEEEVNQVAPFSSAVYYLSRFANRHNLRMRYFETGRVVVSFMTPAEIAAVLDPLAATGAIEIEEREYLARDVGLRWRLTLLMADVGNQLYVIRRRRSPHG